MAACTVSFLLWIVTLQWISAQDYSSQWAAHIEGGLEIAKRITEKHGFILLGEIFPDYYHLEHNHVSKRSVNPGLEHHKKLTSEQNVKWAKQQTILSRSKRDYLTYFRDSRSSKRFAIKGGLNDPKWPKMWYLNRGRDMDMNVQGAWEEGITGKGSVVTILDDGLEKDHPDLIKNYDPSASYDMNNRDEDPMPRYDQMDTNRHGTRCAGEVAATANNSLCSVGIAFGASIGGVRMLDGDVTDAVEARSLSLNPQHIHIYSASWGPDDDGKTVDGPGELATRAFLEGISKGRGGKGSIFIWASGNGGREHDNCNCDGYTNAIWTLSISSATQNGHVPWYSEACSSTLATTYSSGSNYESQIITTDLHHECTSNHTGTSASAPLAAGIVALTLEANNKLTWRDMQHIVVLTARPTHLLASDWIINGVGRKVSHSFGYGLMDATSMVRLARKWKTVPVQHICNVTAQVFEKPVPARSTVTIQLLVKECNSVNFLEHVQAKISLTASRRGDIKIDLTSPSGTKSTLLAPRTHDNSHAGFHVWPFMTVHMWGERPFGTWQLTIHNEGKLLGRSSLHEWCLILYGTKYSPRTLSPNIYPVEQPPKPIPRRNSKNTKKKSKKSKSQKQSTTSVSTLIKQNVSSYKPNVHIVLFPVQNSSKLSPTLTDNIQTYPSSHRLYSLQNVDGRQTKKNLSPERNISPTTSATMTDWEMVFYGTIFPPEQTHMLSTMSVNQNQTSEDEPEIHFKSGECRVTTTKCLECALGYNIHNGECTVNCPVKTYANSDGVCSDCHYTCYKCNGPNDYQCTTCWGDADLTHALGQTYCYSKNIKHLLDDKTWHIIATVLLIINIFVLLIFCKGGVWMRYKPGLDHGDYRLANQFEGDDC
ncbi:furin-like protease 1, isoforms 1/1-X/2 isoform X1 [Melanaphis sacchari]|uniref:furin-like protease 1, isoforms 1/1-X/2 isoform X1 n=1 Tax=Melanaphis sacchari TaxID=742174 RepID=UPI000DC158AE|nr:furin-like protease 1, isoforms 1/1-X/2 isoform X1 [Melanaphis sacchari]XP_025204358.1 furin-like protease 1, isoforms 1/1-X/2 isoform X1 [Melanaphis sacchari]